jgi:hypothetical protein
MISVFDIFAEREISVVTPGVTAFDTSTPLWALTVPPIETKLNINDTAVAPAIIPNLFMYSPIWLS